MNHQYQEMNGVKIPTEIEAEWNLAEGDFSYAQLVVDEIEYNVPAGY